LDNTLKKRDNLITLMDNIGKTKIKDQNNKNKIGIASLELLKKILLVKT